MLLVFGRNRMVVVTGLILLLIVAAIILSRTHAGRPTANARYHGTVDVESSTGRTIARLAISFRIDADATHVERIAFGDGVPAACGTSVPGALAAVSSPITHADRFVARVPIRQGTSRVGTATIAANFETFGRATGALATNFSSPALRRCGVNAAFSAAS